jgi:predicted Rossmann fold flavoprotein
MEKKLPYSFAIIGGGAAGFFAAINTAILADQLKIPINIKIFESSNQYLKKVRISGGGRCNVTHNCFDVRLFCQNYPRGSKELLSPMQRFQAQDTIEWFKKEDIEIVAEEDGRMFPVSNSSETIINCFLDLVKKYNIELLPQSPIKKLSKNEINQWQLELNNETLHFVDAVLIATGSSAGGYVMAQSLGHTISERAPSLFSFKIKDLLIDELQGLSFAKTSLKLSLADKKIFKQVGPTLITHWGLSGPAVLKISAWAAREMKRSNYKAVLSVNWLADKNTHQIESELNQLRSESGKSLIKNVYPNELPKRFWLNLLNKNKISLDLQWANISKREMSLIIKEITDSQLEVLGQNRFKDEFVECGGVALNEIQFKTMESKIFPDLYFAGEILDVDGITGGFNFQNAWTTAWITAQSVIKKATLESGLKLIP